MKDGITLAKQNKYRNRLDSFISSYTNLSSPDYGKIELLRHRIAAFSSREVYLTKHFRTSVWRVKGFISNYGELRYLLDTGLIEANTKAFLKDAIDDAFKKAGINKPYFLMGGGKITILRSITIFLFAIIKKVQIYFINQNQGKLPNTFKNKYPV